MGTPGIAIQPVDPDRITGENRRVLKSALLLAFAAGSQPVPSDRELEDELTYGYSKGFPYVITKDGKKVGGAVIRPYWDYRAPKYTRTGGSIDSLGVLKPYQGQGIGSEAVKLLAAAAVNHFPGRKYVHIAYDKANGRAGDLYKRLGFEQSHDWGEGVSLYMQAAKAAGLAGKKPA